MDSVLALGQVGIQRGMEGLRRNADTIANTVGPAVVGAEAQGQALGQLAPVFGQQRQGGLETALVEQLQYARSIEASVQVVTTGDRLLGTLLDEMV